MRSCHQQDDYMKVIQYIKTLVLLDKTRHIFLSNKPIYVEIGWFWNLGPLVSLLTELPNNTRIVSLRINDVDIWNVHGHLVVCSCFSVIDYDCWTEWVVEIGRKNKCWWDVVCYYIAQYPVHWTAQSAKTIRSNFHQVPSIARYSFIQWTGASWRERKCPIFETVAKGIRTRDLFIAFYCWATALHCFPTHLLTIIHSNFVKVCCHLAQIPCWPCSISHE